MRRTLLALALVLVACGDSRRSLPGTLWFVEDGPPRKLVRIAGGVRREWTGDLYPSGYALPDGRLVAIASRGDGSPEAEQLALVARDDIERIGPRAPQVRDPAVDRAGRWIVVAANPEGTSELYRIDVASGAAQRLTSEPEGNFAPALLDTGTLVFASSRDGDSEIYRMPASGGDAKRLTAFHRDDWQPTPSPDGKTIAFASDREGAPRIFVMRADGAEQHRLTARSSGEESDPAWSPDGRSIAYVIDGGVVVHELATGKERAVTPPGSRDGEPAWSPDGAWLAVTRGGAIWAVPLGGGDAIRVTAGKGVEHLPRWL